ncbi:hypothetical protein SLNWT_1299 [Streptomyces albus]|uniref:Uncharacterized protein n=1 Tax=Streptomyces albus (strain ATCC 21838 / DSM 41398 / FERM P-419 / JCM 4703 / NBRC 107858) TaxID=1081613 RepID=A0A0B5EQX4_STRA4|nr:hypothetical protein SLNWT_1299 [Streptomyces albus]AOU75991.1 hypothetical protein SLNHY_1300 [Streptomyces albus]AYN31792.1 hypothetical protein DUI70_1289 [Streptomyces albus]
MPRPDTPTQAVSQLVAQRIEALYGQPLAELEALADATPETTLLAALTGTHSDLVLAERNIAFQLQRLRELTAPDREVGRFAAGHILDCARRIAESVASRDAYAKSTSAVLGGLRRVSAPDTHPPAPPLPAAPTATTSRTR